MAHGLVDGHRLFLPSSLLLVSLFSLLLLSSLLVVLVSGSSLGSASFFVTPDGGIAIDSTISLVREDGSVQVANVVEETRTLYEAQEVIAIRLMNQSVALVELREVDHAIETQLNQTDAQLKQQAETAQQQQTQIEQHNTSLTLLAAHIADAMVRVGVGESTAILLSNRTTEVESGIVRLTAELAASRVHADAINATTIAQNATISDLFLVTAEHSSHIAALKAQDIVLGDYIARLRADAAILRGRVTSIEIEAEKLSLRQDAIEAATSALKVRTSALEVEATAQAATQVLHAARLVQLNGTQINHAVRLSAEVLKADQTRVNITTLQTLQSRRLATLADLTVNRTSLGVRLDAIEQMTVGSSNLVTDVFALKAIIDTNDARLTNENTRLTLMNTTILAISKAQGDTTSALATRITNTESAAAAQKAAISATLAPQQALIFKYTDTMLGLKSPRLYRYTFESSQSWVVPSGVISAFVTMAGGGGSGYGWRIVGTMETGHSGGYVMSQPISVVAGQTLNIVVGTGGRAGLPVQGALLSNSYYVYGAPTANDGRAGYAGTPSSITTSGGVKLLECSGGSGATPSYINQDTSTLTYGGNAGWTVGLTGTAVANDRVSTGNYAASGSPGACGANDLGRGNRGMMNKVDGSGTFLGGSTPLGFGSGGDIYRHDCWVTSASMGRCTIIYAGRPGIVHLDVMY